VNVKKWCFSTAREKVNLALEEIPVPCAAVPVAEKTGVGSEFGTREFQLADADLARTESFSCRIARYVSGSLSLRVREIDLIQAGTVDTDRT